MPDNKPRFLAPLSEEPPDPITWWQENLDKPRFVYFIQDSDDGPVKIGEAFDPRGRLLELQCGNPRPLHLRAAVLATEQTERRMHRAWQHVRLRGEWFEDDGIIDLAGSVQLQQLQAVGRMPVYDIASMASRLVRPWQVAA